MARKMWQLVVLILGIAIGLEVVYHHTDIAHAASPSTEVQVVCHRSEAAPSFTPLLPALPAHRITPPHHRAGENGPSILPVSPQVGHPSAWLRSVILLC